MYQKGRSLWPFRALVGRLTANAGHHLHHNARPIALLASIRAFVRRAAPSSSAVVRFQVLLTACLAIVLSPSAGSAECLDYNGYLEPLGAVASGSSPEKVVLRPPYAFVAGGEAGFLVVDISDPSAPHLVASIDPDSYIADLALSGDYAYLADRRSYFHVVDIHDPEAPALLGTIDVPGMELAVASAGSYAAVVTLDQGLYMVSAVDPAHPVVVGFLDTPGRALDVAVEGDFAFVADEYPRGLQVADISDPTSPQGIGQYQTYDLSKTITIVDGHAYIGEESDPPFVTTTVEIFDVSNPHLPARLGHVQTGQRVMDVVVSEGRAYLAEYTVYFTDLPSYQIADVNDPTQPIILTDGPIGWASGVALDDGRLWLADHTLQQFSDTDVREAYPQTAGAETPGQANDVIVLGERAYVADRDGGLATFDVAGPGDPPVSRSPLRDHSRVAEAVCSRRLRNGGGRHVWTRRSIVSRCWTRRHRGAAGAL
jgi:hypothetical protein